MLGEGMVFYTGKKYQIFMITILLLVKS